MTDTALAQEVLRLHELATAPPWITHECWPGLWSLETAGGVRIFDCNEFDRHGEGNEHDAKFSAYCRQAAPDLARRLLEAKEDIKATLESLRKLSANQAHVVAAQDRLMSEEIDRLSNERDALKKELERVAPFLAAHNFGGYSLG